MSFCYPTDIRDHRADFGVREFLVERRHFALAICGDCRELRVALVLNGAGREVRRLYLLAQVRLCPAVSSVTADTLVLEDLLSFARIRDVRSAERRSDCECDDDWNGRYSHVIARASLWPSTHVLTFVVSHCDNLHWRAEKESTRVIPRVSSQKSGRSRNVARCRKGLPQMHELP